jgi:hypothetical protein
MRWSRLESEQPRLAEVGRKRLLEPGVILVVTLRRDGSARLSPVEPLLLDGDLWLSMLWGSGDQFVTRWPPGREFVRRGTTATSLGAPQPLTSLLLPPKTHREARVDDRGQTEENAGASGGTRTHKPEGTGS